MSKKIEEYLNHGISPYHLVKFTSKILDKNGFKELKMNEKWQIEAGGRYYLSAFSTSLFAFVIPKKIRSVKMAMAHTDCPTYKVKAVADIKARANCNIINVEPYGGSLKKTWFDRPLGLAGNLVLKGKNPFEPKEVLFDSEEAWLVIASLAPHMDRDIEKKDIDPAKEMNPIASLLTGEDDSCEGLLEVVARKAGVKPEDILSYDLNLYDTSKAEYIGVNKEFIQSARIDNIASCGALVNAIKDIKAAEDCMQMIALLDNEEIGSRSKQGADSVLLENIIKKICLDYGACKNESDIISILSESIMLSCDGAHAVHPNYPEKADTTTVAEMGKGLVIKTSASQRYVTDPRATAIVKAICNDNNIKYQIQANKSGTPGGQTLGPIVSSYLPIMAADMGIPMLAMHSIREMAAVADYEEFERFINAYLG